MNELPKQIKVLVRPKHFKAGLNSGSGKVCPLRMALNELGYDKKIGYFGFTFVEIARKKYNISENFRRTEIELGMKLAKSNKACPTVEVTLTLVE